MTDSDSNYLIKSPFPLFFAIMFLFLFVVIIYVTALLTQMSVSLMNLFLIACFFFLDFGHRASSLAMPRIILINEEH